MIVIIRIDEETEDTATAILSEAPGSSSWSSLGYPRAPEAPHPWASPARVAFGQLVGLWQVVKVGPGGYGRPQHCADAIEEPPQPGLVQSAGERIDAHLEHCHCRN